MKKVCTLAFVIIAMVFATEASAQDFSGLDKSPMDVAAFPSSYKVADKMVRVTYSRPQLKGRALADLAKPGEVWRTGANEATEITFYKDLNFGGKDVKAGTYSLFSIPGEKEWSVILNKNLNQWGAYSYDQGADVVRVSGVASNDGKSLEEFSIAFKEGDGGGQMVMGWGKTRVTVPIKM